MAASKNEVGASDECEEKELEKEKEEAGEEAEEDRG